MVKRLRLRRSTTDAAAAPRTTGGTAMADVRDEVQARGDWQASSFWTTADPCSKAAPEGTLGQRSRCRTAIDGADGLLPHLGRRWPRPHAPRQGRDPARQVDVLGQSLRSPPSCGARRSRRTMIPLRGISRACRPWPTGRGSARRPASARRLGTGQPAALRVQDAAAGRDGVRARCEVPAARRRKQGSSLASASSTSTTSPWQRSG